MEKKVIKATLRTVTGKQVGALRRQGILPGVVYGHHMQPTAISMDLRETSKLLANLTGSSLVDIDLDGKKTSVLVREKQRDFIRGTLQHVDFQAVSLTEVIRTKVGILLQGLSPAVKDFNGMVVTEMNDIEVEALPQNLPERFVLDLSGLKNIGDALHVSDLKVDENVTLLADADEVVAVVTLAGKEEEEVAPVVEGAVAEEPEVIERGKKEEEEEEAE
jgi:large subunit ribosomal protein L25